ncbi:MAG TPA: zf-HC2 domain-containing protein [Thermoanaerobaculia bacterium]|nr:zf-HC2 domain-containing protein [Thermoanaerobaculia bacterium]
MDENRTDFRAALREVAAEEAGSMGCHVGLKRLIAYCQDRLPATESEAVQEHLSLCPRCTGLLLELRTFEAACASGGTGPESPRRKTWDFLARRLDSEGSS